MSQRGAGRRESVCSSLEEKEKEKQKQKAEKEKSGGNFDKEFGKFKNEIKELFQQFDERMDKKLSKLDEKFSKVFDHLKTEIGNIREEVRETKEEVNSLNEKVRDIENTISFQAEKQDEQVDVENDRFRKVDQQLEEMKRNIMLLEKYDRKYNLLFYGIKEEAGENLKVKMKSFFKDDLKIAEERVSAMQFIHLHRTPSEAEGPKPVIVRFLSYEDRELVYSKFLMPVLRDNRQRILTDLPTEMKKARARLAKEAYKIRREESLKTRIKEKGLTVYLEVRKSKEEEWRRREV